jgi:hypothetical protein
MTLPRCSPTAARALLAGLLMLCLVSPCAAQRAQVPGRLNRIDLPLHEWNPPLPYGQRTDVFRRLLFEFRFQPLPDFAQLQTNPSESLLIVLGDPSCLSRHNFPNGLKSFVEQGGATLIATDKETAGETQENLSALAGVTLNGELLTCKRPDADSCYFNSEYCPFVGPDVNFAAFKNLTNMFGTLAPLIDPGGLLALFRNPHPNRPDLRVATNTPSYLRKVRGLWPPGGICSLAHLPASCASADHYFSDSSLPDAPLFAVGGTLGKGRVLVLADHSIFINRMILPRDNDNLEFAINCLHWLRGGVPAPRELLHAANDPQAAKKLLGQRDKVLLWDDGTIRKDFEVPLMTAPIKPSLDMAPAVVAALDRAVTRMEDENVFNRTLRERMEEMSGGRSRVVRNVVYALTLAAILLLGYLFLWRGRHRPESAVPLLAHAVSQHEPKASLLEQRRRALLRSDNVWEMAHQLARQYFESAGIPLSGNAAPRVAMQGSWWQRWRIRRRVARLWQLARGEAPARIPPATLNRWLRDLEELKTDLANGTIILNAECRMQNAE